MSQDNQGDSDNIHNGMMTKVWGPPGWFFLHTVSFGCPVSPSDFDRENGIMEGTTKKNYETFFRNVGEILPCRYCRDSYKKYIAELPPDASSRESLVKWLVQIHNKVNDKLEDKYADASLEQIKSRYERYRAKCNKKQVAKGCSVPLSGKKMCSEITVLYCDEKERKYSELTVFLIAVAFFFAGRVFFDKLVDWLKIKI
tara:strand:- start:2486 stop:3082 length:597 start_codon:yes stop_codon:yes gene_type:complete